MKKVIARAKEFVRSEDGPTATEYAVMLALIVAVVIGVVAILGRQAKEAFQGASDALKDEGGFEGAK